MTYQNPMFPPRRRHAVHSTTPDLLRRQRAEAQATIERLIDFLDETDADADLESGDADFEDSHDIEQCYWRAA